MKANYNFIWKTCAGSTLQLRIGDKILGYLISDTVPGQRVSKNRAKCVWTWLQTYTSDYDEAEYPPGICALPEPLPVFEKHRQGKAQVTAAWEQYFDSLPEAKYRELIWD